MFQSFLISALDDVLWAVPPQKTLAKWMDESKILSEHESEKKIFLSMPRREPPVVLPDAEFNI
jgi:hypothetical protein